MKSTVSLLVGGVLLSLILSGCSHRDEIIRLSGEATDAERRGQHELAIGKWNAVLKLDAHNRQALLSRAALYESVGKWPDAAADYTAYLRLPTNNPDARPRFTIFRRRYDPMEDYPAEPAWVHSRRAWTYAKKGDFEKAIADGNAAIQLAPREADYHVLLAHVYEMKGDPDGALAAFTKAVQAGPKQAAGYMHRGGFYARRGQFAEAITNLDEALRLEPHNSRALMQRAIAFLRHGEFDKALDDLDDAISTTPEDPELYAIRGTTLLQKDKYQEAFNDFNHCLLLRPNDPLALARRGRALLKKGNIELALEDINHALQLNPGEAYFYSWRGGTLAATNRFDEALKDLNHAIELNGREQEFYSTRGYVYNKKGDYGKAIEDYKRAMELNPGSPEAFNNLAWLRATCPEDSFRDGKEALNLATRACELTSFKFQNLVDTLAASYAEVGDFDQAIKYEKQSFILVTSTNKNYAKMQERLALYEEHKPFRQKPNE